MNRGMGGSKLLDRLDNLALVCSFWNGQMESDAQSAQLARQYGHKLSKWQSFDEPIFDIFYGHWYVLKENGEKVFEKDWL